MKITLLACVIFCSFLLASSKPPFLPWLRIYLGLNYIFKEDVDLVHVVVGTNKVGSENFKLARKAAKLLTVAVDVLSPIGGGGSQIGFVQASSPDETKKDVSLRDYNTLLGNTNAIESVGFDSVSGLPAIGKGLKKAKNMFNTDGNNGNKVVVLVTNTARNNANDPFDPKDMADSLKNMGVRICVVIIGSLDNMRDYLLLFMRRISSPYCYRRYNTYREYHDTIETAVKKIIENN